MRESGGSDDWSPVTDFEKSSHQALHNMIANAQPKSVLAVGDTLAAAGTQIQSIADDLSQHIAGLQWTGAAADSFTGWARQVVSATDTLAVYTSNTSVAVTMAGQQLTTAQAGMPPVPTADMATVAKFKAQQRLAPNSGLNFDGSVKDPSMAGLVIIPPGGVTQQQAYAAQTNVESAYQEALGQMESLGGSYVGAVSTMGVSTVPTFPPLPTTLMPPKGSGTLDTSANSAPYGGSTSGSRSSYGGGTGTGSATKPKADSSGNPAQGGAGGVTIVPVQPPAGGGNPGGSTTLQGAQPPTPVTAPSVPTTGGGGSGGSGGIGGGAGGGSPIVPPPMLGTGGLGGSGATGGGSFGGGGGATGFGTGTAEGDAGISGGTVAGAAGGGRFGATAIGEADGGLAYPDGGGAGGVAGSVGGAAGLSSSTATSGIAGTSSAGEAAAATSEGRSSGEMMPGMGMGGMGRMGGSNNKRKGRRAGYLVEDEETWTSGTPGANPAVIE